jgi:hypothetical protein
MSVLCVCTSRNGKGALQQHRPVLRANFQARHPVSDLKAPNPPNYQIQKGDDRWKPRAGRCASRTVSTTHQRPHRNPTTGKTLDSFWPRGPASSPMSFRKRASSSSHQPCACSTWSRGPTSRPPHRPPPPAQNQTAPQSAVCRIMVIGLYLVIGLYRFIGLYFDDCNGHAGTQAIPWP